MDPEQLFFGLNGMFVESGQMDSVLLRIRCVPANGGLAGVRLAFDFSDISDT